MSDLVQKRGEIISMDIRSKISLRYHTVTSAINREFWNVSSDSQNSLYVGSYGRGTAIDTSDLDILVLLPEKEYERHDALKGNGQSRLLQTVKQAILTSYPRSDVRADGQVVKITFFDGMKFEILPAFKNLDWFGNWDGSYKYPDSNMGGNWRSTNPKAEQEAIKIKNQSSNGLFCDTCKHLRFIRDNHFSSYHLSGIVIDSFVYQAIGDWRWTPPGDSSSAASGSYEKVLIDYLTSNSAWGILLLYAPGSGQKVLTESSLECLKKVMNYIAI
ncbi:nucleotidyltransferase-like protein [Kineothrix alysoides]|uniref:Nucleotidyltransferase-like protein n=1 Tax=Kineothrix alysoides TaxID=1469948 RepID=A0A4R1R6Q4_9FIRM|nr:nucleotidyltransferase domain-containing protein [Kineothrix alysoides]TCL61149.1 nucleotidyltransferase-like protein [Kineothrix alysoides]